MAFSIKKKCIEQIMNLKECFLFCLSAASRQLSYLDRFKISSDPSQRIIGQRQDPPYVSSTAAVSSRAFYLVFPLENNWSPDRDAARVVSYRPQQARCLRLFLSLLVLVLLGSINTCTNRMYCIVYPSIAFYNVLHFFVELSCNIEIYQGKDIQNYILLFNEEKLNVI